MKAKMALSIAAWKGNQSLKSHTNTHHVNQANSHHDQTKKVTLLLALFMALSSCGKKQSSVSAPPIQPSNTSTQVRVLSNAEVSVDFVYNLMQQKNILEGVQVGDRYFIDERNYNFLQSNPLRSEVNNNRIFTRAAFNRAIDIEILKIDQENKKLEVSDQRCEVHSQSEQLSRIFGEDLLGGGPITHRARGICLFDSRGQVHQGYVVESFEERNRYRQNLLGQQNNVNGVAGQPQNQANAWPVRRVVVVPGLPLVMNPVLEETRQYGRYVLSHRRAAQGAAPGDVSFRAYGDCKAVSADALRNTRDQQEFSRNRAP